MTEREVLLRELQEGYENCENSDLNCDYDEENDDEGFELKMLEYELFGIH